jgi:tRNA(adenine34) deaminase
MDANPGAGALTLSSDEDFMRLAIAQGQQAAAQGEVPVGAVVVRAGQVIAAAHNAPLENHDPTAHAEIRALRLAAQAIGNYRLDDCTLYVTLEPCAMCSGAILHARLPRVVFGATEPRTGAAGSVLDVFGSALNHQTQVTSGVLQAECAALMQSFFAERRLAQKQGKQPLREDALRTPDHCFADLPRDMSRYASDWPSLQGWRVHWFDNRSDETQAPVVYLHGPDSWSAAFLSPLQTDAPALAFDWLGFGLSDKPKKESAYSALHHAQVLADFLSQLRTPPTHLYAPRSCAPVLLHLPVRWQSIPLSFIDEPDMPAPLAQAPYPDRGHEAGKRAWRTM